MCPEIEIKSNASQQRHEAKKIVQSSESEKVEKQINMAMSKFQSHTKLIFDLPKSKREKKTKQTSSVEINWKFSQKQTHTHANTDARINGILFLDTFSC